MHTVPIAEAMRDDCMMFVTPVDRVTWASPLHSTYADIYGTIYDPSIDKAASANICAIYNNKRDIVGLVSSHGALPGHFTRKCVMDNLATRHVNYYLDPTDDTKKEDGTASILTGADGDVMTEFPITYCRIETLPDGRVLYLMSLIPFTGAVVHPFFLVGPGGNTARVQYVGSYEAVLCDAAGIPLVTDQDAASGGTFVTGYKARSVAGAKPWTAMNLATLRTACANNGCQSQNSLFGQYLMLLMMIEGCSLDTQTTISPGFTFAKRLDYRYTRLTGRSNFGTGAGSVLADATIDSIIAFASLVVNSIIVYRDSTLDANNYFGWNSFSGSIYYTASVAPTNGSIAYSDTAGTNSGYTTASYSTATDAQKVISFSYRGIENPFGHVWKFEDGIQKYQNVVGGVVTDGCYWWTADTNLYTSVDQNAAASPTYTRVAHAWSASGWAKTWSPDSFFPLMVGGDNSTYMCDYFYNDAAAGACVVFRGGTVSIGAAAGVGSVNVSNGLAYASATLGGRIAC